MSFMIPFVASFGGGSEDILGVRLKLILGTFPGNFYANANVSSS